MDHFIGREEYEKCAKIACILKNPNKYLDF